MKSGNLYTALRNLKGWINATARFYDRKLAGKQEFVVISNNCWGGYIYTRLGKTYNTPFVGLYLYGPDYIRLLENFDQYMNLTLSFTPVSKWIAGPVTYPIGLLGDVEIHFLHYTSQQQAEEKWTRRLSRMRQVPDKENYYFKFCDREIIDSNLISRFHELPFAHKLSFGIRPYCSENHLVLTEKDNDSVPDGYKLYNISSSYMDPLKWVKTGKIRSTVYSRLKSAAKRTY